MQWFVVGLITTLFVTVFGLLTRFYMPLDDEKLVHSWVDTSSITSWKATRIYSCCYHDIEIVNSIHANQLDPFTGGLFTLGRLHFPPAHSRYSSCSGMTVNNASENSLLALFNNMVEIFGRIGFQCSKFSFVRFFKM